MIYLSKLVAVAVCGVATSAFAQTVDARLTFGAGGSQESIVVLPGQVVDWTLQVQTTPLGDGIAYFVCDLVAADTNPATLVLAEAVRGPSGATAPFDIPLGIANVKQSGASAFGGQVDSTGALREIGGGQNALGTSGPSGVLQQTTPLSGVGQSGWVVWATGSITMPMTEGVYSIDLSDANASIFKRVMPSPILFNGDVVVQTSPTIPVPVVIDDGQQIVVSTTDGCNDADLADPRGILDLSDVDAFIIAFAAGDPIADLVEPFGVVDLSDADAFIDAFLLGCPGGVGGDPDIIDAVFGGGAAQSTAMSEPCGVADRAAPYGSHCTADLVTFVNEFSVGSTDVASFGGDPALCDLEDIAVFATAFVSACQ